MSDDILKQLESFKQIIDERKAARNQVEAEVKWNMQKLKETFDCDSIDEANGLLVAMLEEVDKDEKKLVNDYADLVREIQEKGLI